MNPRLLLAATCVVAAAVPAALAAPAVAGGDVARAHSVVRVDADPAGDKRGSAATQAHFPGRAGQADLRRTTYTVRAGALVISYHTTVVRRPSRQVTVQLSSTLGLDGGRGSDLDVTTSYGGAYDFGTTVFVDRSVSCQHTRIPTRIAPRQRTVTARVPLRCLQGARAVSGDAIDTYVFARHDSGTIGKDLSRADWTLRLPQ